MRVGIFTESYPPLVNGVSTSILMLQRALEKQGHEVFIITVGEDNKTSTATVTTAATTPSIVTMERRDMKKITTKQTFTLTQPIVTLIST